VEEYFMMLRSREEIELLENEVKSALKYYSDKKEAIEAQILHHSHLSSAYNVGAKCLLMRLLEDVLKLQNAMDSTFRAMKERSCVQDDIFFSGDSDFDSDNDD